MKAAYMGPKSYSPDKLYEELRPKEDKKQIFIVQGDLDEGKVRQLPEKFEGYVLVTGNVNFTNPTTVCAGLIVLGSFEACRSSIWGDLQVYGDTLKATKLVIHGNLVAKATDEIGDMFLLGERIFC